MNKFKFKIDEQTIVMQYQTGSSFVEVVNDYTGEYEKKQFPDRAGAKAYYLQEFKRLLFCV